MHKYYDTITTSTNLSRKAGDSIVIWSDIQILVSSIISKCAFLQELIQQVIYITHGAEIFDANKTLKDFPNPKSRVDFLCDFPYKTPDIVIDRAFNYARTLFRDIYEIRNVLAHEVWSSSDDYPRSVLFSTLDENARLLMASGRIWHKDDTKPQDIYNATIRFIRNVKIVNVDHLNLAMQDINICSWSLMNITHLLDEKDDQRRHELREAFLIFRGTSHLFDDTPSSLKAVKVSSSKAKTINGSADT